MAKWFTIDEDDDTTSERLTAAWPSAPLVNIETCDMILEVARDQVWDFAPESGDDDAPVVVPDYTSDDVPKRLVYAQLKQAENLWNAGNASGDGTVGDGYSFTPRPLDKTIRGIIRPIKGTFSVG
jgi:hypothetical protein